MSIAIEQSEVVCEQVKEGLNIPVLGPSDRFSFNARVPQENGKSVEWVSKMIEVQFRTRA